MSKREREMRNEKGKQSFNRKPKKRPSGRQVWMGVKSKVKLSL